MDIERIMRAASQATSADVQIERLGPNKVCVSVHWPQTQGEGGDHCYGQNTILLEAYAVLDALQNDGLKHTDFGGRKSMGHSGGTTCFAMAEESA